MQAARGTSVATDHPAPERLHRRTRWLVAVAAVVVAADAISKAVVVATLSDRAPVSVVGNVLSLTVARNAGAAFSLGAGATVVFSAVAVAVVVVIARTARRLASRGWATALGLLLGGALGNLGDRIFRSPAPFRGHVVDWIHLTHWPVFNLADSAIVVGAVLALILSARGIELSGRSQ